MHSTNSQLRKYRKDDTACFKCYYHKKTKHNYKHYNGKCKFSITVGKSKDENHVIIISVSLVHNHVMCSTEVYRALIFKSRMCNLQNIIKEEIQDCIRESQENDTNEPLFKKLKDNTTKSHNKQKENSLRAKLRPKTLLESIQKTNKPLDSQTKLLLEELNKSTNKELKKKFSNLVNKIKKEILLSGL